MSFLAECVGVFFQNLVGGLIVIGLLTAAFAIRDWLEGHK